MVFIRLLPPCTQPCTEQGVNKVKISIWASMEVGACQKSISVNLSVYLRYGFLATSKPQKNVIIKTGGISINQYCQTGMASMPAINSILPSYKSIIIL